MKNLGVLRAGSINFLDTKENFGHLFGHQNDHIKSIKF